MAFGDDYQRRRAELGRRYFELDRTPTVDAAGVQRPPAGLFRDQAEATGYLGARARSGALPIEAPTTQETVGRFRDRRDAPPPGISGEPFVMDRDGSRSAQAAGVMSGTRPMRPPFDYGAGVGQAQGAAPGTEPGAGGPPGAARGTEPGAGGPPPGAGRGTEPGAGGPPGAGPSPGGGGADVAGQWMRNRRTGERRFFPEAPAQGAARGTEPGAGGPPPVMEQEYSAAPPEGMFRDEQVRAGIVMPGADASGAADARDLTLRRQGLELRAGNTMLSAAARADARGQLAELSRNDRQGARRAQETAQAQRQDATTRYVAELDAGAKTAQSQAQAAGRSPVFSLPGGRQGLIVGNLLVDAETNETLADARKGDTLDPMLLMNVPPDERSKTLLEWRRLGGKSA